MQGVMGASRGARQECRGERRAAQEAAAPGRGVVLLVPRPASSSFGRRNGGGGRGPPRGGRCRGGGRAGGGTVPRGEPGILGIQSGLFGREHQGRHEAQAPGSQEPRSPLVLLARSSPCGYGGAGRGIAGGPSPAPELKSRSMERCGGLLRQHGRPLRRRGSQCSRPGRAGPFTGRPHWCASSPSGRACR